jgi:hypothetical protein
MQYRAPVTQDLRRHVHVIADGVEVELPPQTQGIILLNINSYMGGGGNTEHAWPVINWCV